MKVCLVVVLTPWLAGMASGGEPARGGKIPFVRVPDPLSGENPTYPVQWGPVPEVGTPWVDPRFGVTLTRVTRTPGIRHEYSRFDPFNKGQSLILLIEHAEGQFRVYRTNSMPYDSAGNFVRTVDLEEPRWDPNDPNVVWGFQEFRIVRLDVNTGETRTFKDFAGDPVVGPLIKAERDLYRITSKDEGEASRDFRYWAFCLQGSNEDYRLRYLFTWDREEDRVLGMHKITKQQREVDCAGMSPLGNWVWIGGEPNNAEPLRGLTIANRELTRFHQIDYAGGHADVGLDVAGLEVIVLQNSRTDCVDMVPFDWTVKSIREPEEGYEGTNRVRLLRLFYASDSPQGFSSGLHISCNAPGWCVVSTHLEPKDKDRNWLDLGLILVRLDARNPEAFYLAKINNLTSQYWEETQATITNDGAKVVWAANWGQGVGKEKCFLMQLDMPAGWQKAMQSRTNTE